jgi:ribonucleoside-diphosphate reductase alpha chain
MFKQLAQKHGFYHPDLMKEIFREGNLKKVKGIPEEMRRVFVTALEIAPEWHVRMQAAFQKHTDNAVSKTVSLPRTSSVEDVKHVFLMAWHLGCKGVTVYRDGSNPGQVLVTGIKG